MIISQPLWKRFSLTHRAVSGFLPATVLTAALWLLLPSGSFANEPGRFLNVNRIEGVGFYVSHGRAFKIWATKRYAGYAPTCLGLFVDQTIAQPSIAGIPARVRIRTEGRYERLSGTVVLASDQVPAKDRNGGPYLKDLDGKWNLALLLVPRLVFMPSWPVRPALHAGVGISWLNERILDEGTYYHYNFLAGLGLEADVASNWTVFADCRWDHYSNGGRMYLTNKAVIGMESVNVVLGMRRVL